MKREEIIEFLEKFTEDFQKAVTGIRDLASANLLEQGKSPEQCEQNLLHGLLTRDALFCDGDETIVACDFTVGPVYFLPTSQGKIAEAEFCAQSVEVPEQRIERVEIKYRDEMDFANDIQLDLMKRGIRFVREAKLEFGRADFLIFNDGLDNATAIIEVKMNGDLENLKQAIGQLTIYKASVPNVQMFIATPEPIIWSLQPLLHQCGIYEWKIGQFLP